MKFYHVGSSVGSLADQLASVDLVTAMGGHLVGRSPIIHGGFFVQATPEVAWELGLTEVDSPSVIPTA